MYFVQPVSNKSQVTELEDCQAARRGEEINCKMPFRQDLIISGRKNAQNSGIPTLIRFGLGENKRNKDHRRIQGHAYGGRARKRYTQSGIRKYPLKRKRTVIVPFKVIAQDRPAKSHLASLSLESLDSEYSKTSIATARAQINCEIRDSVRC